MIINGLELKIFIFGEPIQEAEMFERDLTQEALDIRKKINMKNKQTCQCTDKSSR